MKNDTQKKPTVAPAAVQVPVPTAAATVATKTKEKPVKATGTAAAPKELLTPKQKFFLQQLKICQCEVAGDSSSWHLEDLTVELEPVMNSMAMGAMITTLTQKKILTNTVEVLPDSKNGKKSRTIHLTELGREIITSV